jgi:hypothetical protein
MKLNDTVYKNILSQVREFTLYDKSFYRAIALMIPKQVMGEFYLQCLGTTK